MLFTKKTKFKVILCKGLRSALHLLYYGKSSTTHAIYTFRETVRIRKLEKKDTYALFLEFSKAFDKVNRSKMLVKLRSKFNAKVWLSVVNYYGCATIIVEDTNSKIKSKIKTKSGVKQGGPYSPVAFDDYIDDMIIIIIGSNIVITVHGIVTGIIIYADDTTILCAKWEHLKKIIENFEEYCTKFDIQANGSKTMWMKMGETVRYDTNNKPIIRPATINENFIVNKVLIEKTDRFKFLGFWLLANGSNKEHINKRITMRWMAANDLTQLGFFNQHLNIKVKGTLYNTFIRPKLVYGLENANLVENDVRELEK
jgi:hypothetical protein